MYEHQCIIEKGKCKRRSNFKRKGKCKGGSNFSLKANKMTETYAGNDDLIKSWWHFVGCPRQKGEEWVSEEEYNRRKNE